MAFRSLKRFVIRRLGIDALRAESASLAATLAASAAHQARLDQQAAQVQALLEQSRAAELAQTVVWATMWNAADPSQLPTLVSVVLPTRNRAALLSRAVKSVLQQENVRVELIVVNDASTDGTAAVLAAVEDPRLTVLAGSGDGAAAARNLGIRHAIGEIIAFADDDNVMAPGWLAAAARHLLRHPQAAGVYGAQVREPEGDGDVSLLYRSPFERDELLRGSFIDLGASAFRAGTDGLHFDESLAALLDWDMFIRITATQQLDPIPVLSSFYSTSAPQRITDRPDKYDAMMTVLERATAERPARQPD